MSMAAKASLTRGAFILLEGCDRAGKSTQCARLLEHLRSQGYKAQPWKFPERRTAIGQMINSYLTNKVELDDHAIHLLFSANRWECVSSMKEILQSGTTLIVDRYAFSGAAFSAAKGLDIQWCKQPDMGLLTPDLVLFLDLPVEHAEERVGFGEERYEQRALQERVREMFLTLMESSWKILDARLLVDELSRKIAFEAEEIIRKCANTPLNEDLWCT